MVMERMELRPIVSNRGSASHQLSRFFVVIINPLTGKSSSYVKNSAQFVERISNVPIHSNQMVSLDVVSLFTKVPTDEAFAVVRDKLAADPLLEERTSISIGNLMEMLRQPTSGWDLIYTDKKKDWILNRHCHQCWRTYTWNTTKKWY